MRTWRKKMFEKLTKKQRKLITIGLKEKLLKIRGNKIYYPIQKRVTYLLTSATPKFSPFVLCKLHIPPRTLGEIRNKW